MRTAGSVATLVANRSAAPSPRLGATGLSERLSTHDTVMSASAMSAASKVRRRIEDCLIVVGIVNSALWAKCVDLTLDVRFEQAEVVQELLCCFGGNFLPCR